MRGLFGANSDSNFQRGHNSRRPRSRGPRNVVTRDTQLPVLERAREELPPCPGWHVLPSGKELGAVV